LLVTLIPFRDDRYMCQFRGDSPVVGQGSWRWYRWEWTRHIRPRTGNHVQRTLQDWPGGRQHSAGRRASGERCEHHVPRDGDITWRRTSGSVVRAKRQHHGIETVL